MSSARRWAVKAIILVLSIWLGVEIALWMKRPPGPLRLRVVSGGRLTASYVRQADHYSIREWQVAKPMDEVLDELKGELRQGDGWQPPTTRSLQPRKVQFARVHAGKDFIFDRVMVTDAGPGRAVVTIEESPPQVGAFQ